MFDTSGDRTGLTRIEQLQNNTEIAVGVYDPLSSRDNKITWLDNPVIQWKGHTLPL